jgi:mannose-6-phosphate isomerase-like protein (cupin superfamily)
MYLIEQRDAEVVDGAATLWLLADGRHTGGALGANRLRLGPGVDGARPHYHERSSEAFYVLEGTMVLLVEDELLPIGAGGYVVVPPGVPHAFAAAPGDVADLFITVAPGVDRFEYFRMLPAIMRGEVGEQALAEVHERYDVHFVDSPRWAARTEA